MTLTGAERAALRAEAQKLKALAHVGQHGITAAVLQSIDDVLRTRELGKIQFGRSTEVSAKDAANDLAEKLGAEVVQVIGRAVTLYRHNPDLPHRPGDEPAWRR